MKTRHYRISFECYECDGEQEKTISQTVIMSGTVERPVDVFNFGLSHVAQIQLLHGGQDTLLKEQIKLIDAEVIYCPCCPDRKLIKNGKQRSW